MSAARTLILIGVIVMATAVIRIALTERSRRVIDAWQQRPRRVIEAIDAATAQVLTEVESHVKAHHLSGQSAKVRTGALRQDLTHQQTDAFGGYVGTTARTAPYARTILGPDVTTIRPVRAKHLWVPIADNLNPSGVARLTPREAMSLRSPSGRRLLRVFRSRRGNLVAFLPDAAGGRYQRGRKKGLLRGRLLFVLKDSVAIQGTDALARGAQEMRARITVIFNSHLQRVGGEG